MNPEVPNNLDLELLAAQLRRHTDDLTLYSGMLLNILSAALPADLIEVRREGKLKARMSGRKEPAVLGVSVTLGNQRFDLSRPEFSAPAITQVSHQSGGVVMSSSRVPAAEWSRQLASALSKVAGTNTAALEALERLTGP